MTRAAFVLIVALGPAVGACVGDDSSPAGIGLVPGDVLGGLRVAVSSSFEPAIDYSVFPADRARAERLTTAHEWPAPAGFESRAVFRFELGDLDSLPQETEFVEHRLRLLFIPPPEEVSFAVHRLTSAWSEEAASWTQREFGEAWSAPGGDFDPLPVARFVIAAAPEDTAAAASIDSVTVPLPDELVADWRSGEVPNHGLILIQETPGAVVDFASRNVLGTTARAPTLEIDVLLSDATAATLRIPAREDSFLPHDESPFSSDGLVVRGVEPPSRAVLKSTFREVPAGATVASVQLVLTVRAVDVPRDSLLVFAVPLFTEFRGESTILALISSFSPLVTIDRETQPGDSVVFESVALTALVRQWIARPESNRGLALRLPEIGPTSEGLVFGGVQFHGVDAAAALRPRARIVFATSVVPGETE